MYHNFLRDGAPQHKAGALFIPFCPCPSYILSLPLLKALFKLETNQIVQPCRATTAGCICLCCHSQRGARGEGGDVITMGKTRTFSVVPEGLDSVHLVRHTQSDRHSCVKNERGLEGEVQTLAPFSPHCWPVVAWSGGRLWMWIDGYVMLQKRLVKEPQSWLWKGVGGEISFLNQEQGLF